MTDSKLPGAWLESRLSKEKCPAWQILGMSSVPTARPEAPLACVTVAPPAEAGLISTACSSRSTSPSTICLVGQPGCPGASPSSPTRSWPVWRWPRSCSPVPPNIAGFVSQWCGWAISSPTCPSSRATTSACGRFLPFSVGFFGISPGRRLLTTPDGLVVDWCLADPKLGEAEVAEALLDGSPLEEGQIIVCDKASPTASWKQESASWGPLCSAPIARMSLLATALSGPGPPVDREHHRHPQRAALARRARRPYPGRGHGAGRPEVVGSGGRRLVELADQRPREAFPGCLRPLSRRATFRNQSSRPAPPWNVAGHLERRARRSVTFGDSGWSG